MITLITGTPGAGKTALAVKLLMDRWAGTRAIYANVDGLLIEHVELEDPTKWVDVCPQDSVIVVDECQRVWRRDRSSRVTRDIEAMETHRHEGIDFYLISQNPALIHENIMALVGRHIHLRDVGVLGRMWYEWPEAVRSPQTSWRMAPIKHKYRLPKQIFKYYKSAEVHSKIRAPIPPRLIIFVAMVLCFLVGCYVVGKRFYSQAHTPVESAAAPAKAAAALVSEPSGSSAPALPPADSAAPLAPAPVRIAGCIRMGDRCECLDADGKLAGVEKALCFASAERGGLAVPYEPSPVESRSVPAAPVQAAAAAVPAAENRT